ncbi:MAG: hypothetical protein CFE44_11115 [Burkholderiales bacterium PBB4]|nr:MAG: hypothetical protein CFE44_11115 [Burkholderiales bacterium PBB4]
MTGFHFAFDLNYFGWIRQDFYRDPVWTVQRTCILSLFLFCAGVAQAIAFSAGQSWPQFWRRWSEVAICAALVSLGSWWMFPQSWIYFGVLHGIAAMLILTRLSARCGNVLGFFGAIVLTVWCVAPWLHSAWGGMSIFNLAYLSWVGLAKFKPVTEDYVPLFPWIAVMWWGFVLGIWWNNRTREKVKRPDAPVGPLQVVLGWLGRHSLLWYMLHQPVMLGVLTVIFKT